MVLWIIVDRNSRVRMKALVSSGTLLEPRHLRPPKHILVFPGMLYWVDGRTQESTWKHPHYDKYRQMLQVCRKQKILPHWKSIMAFQIEFLFSTLFTWEAEATGK